MPSRRPSKRDETTTGLRIGRARVLFSIRVYASRSSEKKTEQNKMKRTRPPHRLTWSSKFVLVEINNTEKKNDYLRSRCLWDRSDTRRFKRFFPFTFASLGLIRSRFPCAVFRRFLFFCCCRFFNRAPVFSVFSNVLKRVQKIYVVEWCCRGGGRRALQSRYDGVVNCGLSADTSLQRRRSAFS